MDLAELLDILRVSPAAEPGVFVGRSPHDRIRSVYGGQFLAQSLLAAGATVPADRLPHSLHAYFVRSGDPTVPIRYEVEAVRDGRSFSHRQVVARQDGKEVFRQLMSFHVGRPGPTHDDPVPWAGTTIDPAVLTDYVRWAEVGTDNTAHDYFTAARPVEIRYQNPPGSEAGIEVRGVQELWIRLNETVADDSPLLHAALLAWLSDMTIGDFATLAHGRRWTDADADSTSLDHAMWFLRPARADGWLCYRQESPASASGRAFTRGEFVTLDGIRVGTVTQEVLVTLPD